MTNKNILILFVIGLVLIVAGIVAKTKQWEYASLLLIVGMTFNAVALISLISKMMRKDNNKDGFLDS